MRKLILLFALLPPLDLFLLFKLGKAYGAGLPIAWALVAGACGAWLARRLGLRAVRDWQRSLESGRPPDESVIGGAIAIFGCLLLMLPGVLTDIVGISLLVPRVRRWAALHISRRIVDAIQQGSLHVVQGPSSPFGPRRSVIDVEAEVVESTEVDKPPKQLGN